MWPVTHCGAAYAQELMLSIGRILRLPRSSRRDP